MVRQATGTKEQRASLHESEDLAILTPEHNTYRRRFLSYETEKGFVETLKLRRRHLELCTVRSEVGVDREDTPVVTKSRWKLGRDDDGIEKTIFILKCDVTT